MEAGSHLRAGHAGESPLQRAIRLSGVSLSGMVVLLALAIAWPVAHVVGGRGLYLLVYMGLLLLGASYALARRRRSLTAARSKLARRAREGQSLEVELTLESRGRLSMFTVEERIPSLVGSPVRVAVEKVTPAEPWVYSYTLRPRLRGVYRIGPLTASWTDPLGLARSEQTILQPIELIVHPTTEPVFDRPLTRELEDPPIRPPKTKPWPQGFEFYGMRDYVRGDDLRRVVWKAVARTGRMLVRESEQGITDRVNIIIDTDRDWHQPGRPSDTFEAAVRVAASIGTGHIKDGFSVSLDSNSASLAENLRGPRARIAYLDELARLQLGKEPLAQALERVLARNARRSHNVIITPHFDSRAAARAGLLTDAGASMLVAVITWEETDPGSALRAGEIGAQVVQVRPGAALAGTFAHALGAGIR